MRFETLAYRKQFIAGDSSAFDPADRLDKRSLKKSFRCDVEELTGEQLIRAGRDSAERAIRIYYRQRDVSLTNGDYVTIKSADWLVVRAEVVQPKGILYAELQEVV